jgi:aspartate aminotransferase
MTGWRCGWSLGPAPAIAAQHALQSHATSNVSSITQKAAVAALAGSQAPVSAMLDQYRQRRDAVHAWITADPRLRAAVPAGAFYLFVDVRRLLDDTGIATTTELAQALLEESRVAVTPGEAFAAPGFIRLSFAASMETLREGIARLHQFSAARAARAAARS